LVSQRWLIASEINFGMTEMHCLGSFATFGAIRINHRVRGFESTRVITLFAHHFYYRIKSIKYGCVKK